MEMADGRGSPLETARGDAAAPALHGVRRCGRSSCRIWSTPHYGMHYVLDTPGQRLILAAPFAHSLFPESQGPGAGD